MTELILAAHVRIDALNASEDHAAVSAYTAIPHSNGK